MPYLLSSLDGGEGMMAMLKETVDFLTWGNHETDLDHEQVCDPLPLLSFLGTVNCVCEQNAGLKHGTISHAIFGYVCAVSPGDTRACRAACDELTYPYCPRR